MSDAGAIVASVLRRVQEVVWWWRWRLHVGEPCLRVWREEIWGLRGGRAAKHLRGVRTHLAGQSVAREGYGWKRNVPSHDSYRTVYESYVKDGAWTRDRLTPRKQLESPYHCHLPRLLLPCLRVPCLSRRACSPSVLRALSDHSGWVPARPGL